MTSEPLSPLPPPPPRPVPRTVDDASGWWVAVLFGTLLVGLGVWMLTNLVESVVLLGLLVGFSLVAAGLVDALLLGGRQGLGWVAWLSGMVLVVVGSVVLAWPGITLWAIAVLAGVGLLVVGLFDLLLAMTYREEPDRHLHLAVAALTTFLGAIVLCWPDATLVFVATVFGLRALAAGLVAVFAALHLRLVADASRP